MKLKRGEKQSAQQPSHNDARPAWWSFSRASGKIWLILAGVLLVLALGGSFYAWHTHVQYRKSPVFALDQLNAAIQQGDANLLGEVVDANSLSAALAAQFERIAPNVAAQFARITPGFVPTPVNSGEEVKNYLAEFFSKKENKSRNIALVPENAAALLKNAPFELVAEQGGSATIRTTMNLPFRSGAFIELRLESGNGWKVVDMPNAQELLQAYLERLTQLADEAEQVREIDRQIQISGMTRNLPNLTCRAGVMRIGSVEPVMVLSVTADAAPRPESIDSIGVRLTLRGKNGEVLLEPYVQDSSPQLEGSSLQRSFTQPVAEDLFMRLEAAAPISCEATPEFLRLGSKKIFRYRAESPN